MVEHQPTLDQREEQVRVESLRLEPPTLGAIELLLNNYLTGFGEFGRFTRTDFNRREQVWLLLTLRTFHSLRWAYHLLMTGYYSQSLTLIRTAAEDWLYCEDSKEHEETIRFLLDHEGNTPQFKTMSDRLGSDLKEAWQGPPGEEGSYSLLSSFSHPNYRGMAVLFDQEKQMLRVGPCYDESMFLVAANYLIFRLIKSVEFLGRLVSSASPQSRWLSDPDDAMAKGEAAREGISVRIATLLEATGPDVDPA